MNPTHRSLALLALMAALRAAARAEAPVALSVDMTDAPRHIIHARLTIPATPGSLTLVYPKWIPGEHSPSGPLGNLAGLRITANGQPLDWKRDSVEFNRIHTRVPAGVTAVEVALDDLGGGFGPFSGGNSSTGRLAVLAWNRVVLYPAHRKPDEIRYAATLRLPAGWRYGTALPLETASDGVLRFQPAPLTTLIDSPVLAGEYFKTIDLAPGDPVPHFLHIAADAPESLDVKDETIEKYRRLVPEARALFGPGHYRSYHFLLTLSDRMGGFGLEHHESSDNRMGGKFLTDASQAHGLMLLPHEYTHSWNGKYRRPAQMMSPDYQKPMEGDLLWVYEGLTEYLGDVLTARCGLWTPEQYRDYQAVTVSGMELQTGRQWRSLEDTAISAPLLFSSSTDWPSWTRSADFYPEGALVWLEADTVIRRETKGAKSLDDFCRHFFGGPSVAPAVEPYTLDDLLAALDRIAPYDWRGFFRARVQSVFPGSPSGGLRAAGWALVRNEKANEFASGGDPKFQMTDMRASLGFGVGGDGSVYDIIPGSPADRARLSPGMKIIALNGRKFTSELLAAAMKDSRSGTEPMQLLIEDADYYRTYSLDYHDGPALSPHLERTADPDLLTDILRPHAPGAPAPADNKPDQKKADDKKADDKAPASP